MIKDKILIIGINGFSGRHFHECIKTEFELSSIYGFDRQDISRDLSTSYYYKGDLIDYNCINNLIANIKPKYIINLAGSFTNEYEVDYQNNVG